jgi:hypothetical protein
MAANDMAEALKNPHPDVPFAQVSDGTIRALAKLAAIFKNNFQNQKRQNLFKHNSRPLKTNNLQHWSNQY